jgi:hypothetical protein
LRNEGTNGSPTSAVHNSGAIDGDTVGRDKVVITIGTPPPDAGVVDAARSALPNGTVGHYVGVSRISDGGAVVSGTLDIAFVNTGPGTASLDFKLHGDCSNLLLVADVYPTVIATVYGTANNVISQVRVDVDKTPGRGSPFNGPTKRGHDNTVSVAVDPYTAVQIRAVDFQMFDRGP